MSVAQIHIMKVATHTGGWMDVPNKKWRVREELLSWKSRNLFTSWSITPLHNREFEFAFGQKQARCHAFGSGSGRVMQQSIAIGYFVTVLICRFSLAVRKACALYRLCVRSAHLRGLWWEIEHDQCAQENHRTKMVPRTAAVHISEPSIWGRVLLRTKLRTQTCPENCSASRASSGCRSCSLSRIWPCLKQANY